MSGGKKAMDGLHGPMRDVAEEGKGLVEQFHKITKAVQPSVVQMFGAGLKVIRDLMPALAPLAEAAAKAFTWFFNQINNWLKSPAGKKFIKWLETEAPGAMMTFAKVLWDVAQAVGRTFAFLDHAGQSWWKHLHQGLHSIRQAFDTTRHAIADFAHNVAAHFDELRHDGATWGHDTAHDFDSVRHTVASWGHDVASTFDSVRHLIASWGHNIASTFDSVRHTIASWADNVRHWIDNVIRWFEQLPGRILSALGNLGSLLIHSGESLISGLITGIENAVPGLHSALSWVSSLIPSWKGPMSRDLQMLVPNGQAIMAGLVSGLNSKLPDVHAQMNRTTAAITGGIGGAAGGGYGTAGGGQKIEITLQLQGDGQLTHAIAQNLKGYVRTKGGGGKNSVQIALGQAH